MRYVLIVIAALLCLAVSSCVVDKTDDAVFFSGTITDSSGKGIPDVKIHVISTYNDLDVSTSSDGYYSFSLPSGGLALLLFSKDKYTSQKEEVSFEGGGEVTINKKLNTLSEDSYLIIKDKIINLRNIRGSELVSIQTNTSYDAVCGAQWLTITRIANNGLWFDYSKNESPVERTATILFTSEYGHKDSVTIKQAAGSAQ